MNFRGNEEATVWLVSEHEESPQGVPLSGPDGRTLDELLVQAGIDPTRDLLISSYGELGDAKGMDFRVSILVTDKPGPTPLGVSFWRWTLPRSVSGLSNATLEERRALVEFFRVVFQGCD